MGANSSSISELHSNEYLKKLSSTEVISPNDPFWNQLLSFSFIIPISSPDCRLLEESTSVICKTFSTNNIKTGNLASLVQVFLLRSAELKASAQCEDNIFTWQTYNALFIIRNICKYCIENLSEEVLLQQFKDKSSQHENKEGDSKCVEEGCILDDLFNSLFELLVDVDVLPFTYALHLESLNTLLVLLSIQMFQPRPASSSLLYRLIMQGKCSIHSCLLMRHLLQNVIDQVKCPAELTKAAHQAGGGIYGLTAAVASGLWSVMTLGMASKSAAQEEVESGALLANQSLLFILVLTNHCTNERGLSNPYRESLFSFMNSQSHAPNTSPIQATATFKIDFSKLYNTLSETLHDDQTTLLLYLLLHRNPNMKSFILTRTNLDKIVMPILKTLYHAQERNSHHIYMALIILLVLSEDDFFNKAVHELVLKNIMWFKERSISEITLGGLLVLVVIRTIQYNMTRMRDKYLHTNCLAALANMSAQFHNLHPYVTQRIVSLLEHLSKKHARLVEQIRQSAVDGGPTGADSGSDTDTDYVQDLAVLEEVIRMVLEIINSCLCNSLHHNPNLIYTLMYQKDLFIPFRTHPTFQDIIQNIDTVLAYFSNKIEQHDKNLSVPEVQDIIQQGAQQFRKDRLKKFPELKFKYVEEDQPEEFFIPYVWSLVYHSSNLYFNPSKIQLFSLNT
ncbi:unnamed protein product [Owenia fusiformis]|uniref:Dymeclin n=1 Tax=Owenia fusiformis TaxID=6347 RepID=A0A8J1TQP9_OWEFU|nr:unnamed protein product [Owenia fusiformis]CAH1789251.1 unnamed protein product [Owenia fusiformis]